MARLKLVSEGAFIRLLVFVALCSLAGLLSPLNWFFDLFNHFRPQAILAALLLLVPVSCYKSRIGIALALAIVVLNAGIMGWRIHSFAQNASETASGKSISILVANVNTLNTEREEMTRLVHDRKPDIFVALEVNGKWKREFDKLKAEWPHNFTLSFDDNFGLAVYSKIPFKERIANVGMTYQLPLFIGDFGGFVLMALHPFPPTGKNDAMDTAYYLAEAGDIAAQFDKPLIVAGDLNTTLWSDNIKPFLGAGLAPVNASGIAWTWPAGILPLAIQIDHIFVKAAAAQDFTVLGDIGSDHYPVEASIHLPSPE